MSSETRAPERPIRKANPNAHSHATNMQFAHRQNAHAVPPPSLLRRGSSRRAEAAAEQAKGKQQSQGELHVAPIRSDALHRHLHLFPLQGSTDVFPPLRVCVALRCVALRCVALRCVALRCVCVGARHDSRHPYSSSSPQHLIRSVPLNLVNLDVRHSTPQLRLLPQPTPGTTAARISKAPRPVFGGHLQPRPSSLDLAADPRHPFIASHRSSWHILLARGSLQVSLDPNSKISLRYRACARQRASSCARPFVHTLHPASSKQLRSHPLHRFCFITVHHRSFSA
ncbi:hypothetical protein L1887_51194 [Cichorium endivia]|nr:hypothetical protein L1887_51194 [Cichorium endivia]